jgi:hypothetical protein
MRAELVAVLALLLASTSHAYPQYLARGHAACSSCHVSPSGGGLTSAFGQSSTEALFPDWVKVGPLRSLRASVARLDPTGYSDSGGWKLGATAGVDVRLLALRASMDVGLEPEWLAIPMLAEVSGVAALGPLQLYATATALKRSTADATYSAMSREHWLGASLGDGLLLRGGRLVVPFGLRMPDHTLATREELGFDKYDQSYGVELDAEGEGWTLNAAGFAGDLWLDPAPLRERGGAVRFEKFLLGEQLTLAASAMVGVASWGWRPAAALSARARLFGSAYALAELAGQQRRYRDGQLFTSSAGFLRVGWFPHGSTELFAEVAARWVPRRWELTQLRYQLGVSAHLLPWLELVPSLVLEEDVETGLAVNAMGQLHVIY